MDALQDRLLQARATGALFAQSAATPPWGLRLPDDTQLAVHAVVDGTAWLWFDDPDQAVELRAGDVALVRGPRVHHLGSAPGESRVDLGGFPPVSVRDGQPTVRILNDPHPTDVFLCGAYQFAGDVGATLLASLPDVLHTHPERGDELLFATDLLSRELSSSGPGQQTILNRLLDVVLVLLIRNHFDQLNEHAPGWYVANTHPVLSRSLQAMHDRPGHAWSVPQLAALAGVAPSTFNRLFREVLDQSPMRYLEDWRMSLARDALRTGDVTLAAIAHQSGYSTPYAFSAAFNRHHGVPPGQWRRQSHHADPALSGR